MLIAVGFGVDVVVSKSKTFVHSSTAYQWLVAAILP
jgi:hypothetical protein